MKFNTNKLVTYYPFALLGVIWVLFFRKQIFSGEVFYCCDNLLINIPSKVFLAREILAGRFPLWNPYILSGMPFLADINLGILHPFNILFLWMEPFRALTILQMLSVFIMSIGVYFWARSLGISKNGSVMSSLAAVYSGTTTVYTDNASILFSASWFPWIGACSYAWGHIQNRRTYILLISVLVLQIFSGHPQITYYSWVLVVCTLLVFGEGTFGRKVSKIIHVFIPVFLISAIQLLPFAELTLLSSRYNQGWDYATFGSLHPLSILQLFLPAVGGNEADNTVWFGAASMYGYIEIIPVVLAVVGFKGNRKTTYLALISVFSLALAMGKYSLIYTLFYYLVPGISLFRVPTHFLLLYTVCLSLLAGFGLDTITNQKVFHIKYSKKLFLIVFFYSCIGLLCFILLQKPELLGQITSLYPKLSTKISTLEPQNVMKLLYSVWLNAVMNIVFVIGFIIILKLKGVSTLFRTLLILFLVIVDIELHVVSDMHTIPSNTARSWIIQMSHRINDVPGVNRQSDKFYIERDLYEYPKQVEHNNLVFESNWQTKIMRPNLGMLAGVSIPDGYSSLVIKKYHDWWDPSHTDPTGINIILRDAQKINTSAIKFIYSKSNRLDSVFRRFNLYHSDESGTLYENPLAIPRFAIVTNDTISIDGIQEKKISPNELLFQIESTDVGEFVVFDTYFPGWVAKIDNVQVPIKQYDSVFRSIPIKSGNHQVRMVYDPISLKIGVLLSAIGLLIFIFRYRKYE